jgi:hypothetical protein
MVQIVGFIICMYATLFNTYDVAVLETHNSTKFIFKKKIGYTNLFPRIPP